MRILTVMGAVYNGLERVRLRRHQHPREQRLHRRLQCFRQQNGKLPQQHISRDHQPDARGLETCLSAATLSCNRRCPPIKMPTDQKNTRKCTTARHGRCLGGLEYCALLLILYLRSTAASPRLNPRVTMRGRPQTLSLVASDPMFPRQRLHPEAMNEHDRG